MNGTVKKRIWLIPCLKSFLNWSIFSFAQLSDSSVKRAVVIGTVKMEYGSVYQRRAYAATEAPDAETLSCELVCTDIVTNVATTTIRAARQS